MALKSKEEKLILIKDAAGVNRVVIDKDATSPMNDRALSIRQTAESTDVITTVGTYAEVFKNFIDPNGHKLVQKALFVKDMGTQAGGPNTIPIYPGAKEYITFQPGESAIVYYDDDVQTNGFGRPHWMKFLNDDTLGDLSITKIKDLATLTGRKNNLWYYVENMKGYPGYDENQHALVFKRSDSVLDTFKTAEQDYMDGTNIDALHKMAINVLTTSAPSGDSFDAIFMYGDLKDPVQRKNLIDRSQPGQWGTGHIDDVRYMFNILGGDATNGIKIIGFEISDDGTNKVIEAINGLIKENELPTITTGTIIGTQTLTGHYASQVDNLKVIESLSDLTPGLKKDYTFPNGLTTDTVGGCEIAISSTVNGEVRTKTQGFDLRGWDKTKPLYLPVTFHAAATYLWVEIKLEAVAGDNTKYSLTNFASGAGANQMDAFGVASIQFRGDK